MPANQKQASEAPQQLWGFRYFAWLKLVLPHGAGAFWQRSLAPATHAEPWSAGGVWVSVGELYKQLEVCLSELSVVFGRVRSGLGARLAAVVLVGHQWGVGRAPRFWPMCWDSGEESAWPALVCSCVLLHRLGYVLASEITVTHAT